MGFSRGSSSSNRIMVIGGKVSVLMVGLIILIWGSLQSSEASAGTFGFDIHHRYSDQVRSILDFDGMPERYSSDYYAAMAHRDRFIRGRHLADTTSTTPVTFIAGNDTRRINSLGLYVFSPLLYSLCTPLIFG